MQLEHEQAHGRRITRPAESLDETLASFDRQRSQVVWFGGLPRLMHPDDLETHLRLLCPESVHIEALRFTASIRALPAFPGALHRGCALVACDGVEQAKLIVTRLWGQKWGDSGPIVAGPAVDIPKSWDRKLYVLREDLETERLAELARVPHRLHRARRRIREKEDHTEGVAEILGQLPLPGGHEVQRCYQPIIAADAELGLAEFAGSIDWELMPGSCDPACNLKGASNARQRDRAHRKRVQVASYAVLLKQLLPLDFAARGWRPQVVDFGSGSGNLVLPLAVLFPELDFLAIDMKAEAITLLNERAAEARLSNVRGAVGTIEGYGGRCDIVLALHACGNATDYALLQAQRCRAAFVVSPCCVGKLKFSANIGDSIAKKAAGGSSDSTLFLRARWVFVNRAAGGSLYSKAIPKLVDGSAVPATWEGAEDPASAPPPAAAQPRPSTLDELRSVDEPDSSRTVNDASPADATSAPQCLADQLGAASLEGRPGSDPVESETIRAMHLEHPRSAWLRALLPSPVDNFMSIAKAADISNAAQHSYPEIARLAKAHVELDRLMAAREDKYLAHLVQLLDPELTAKADVIVGAPAELAGTKFRWNWVEEL